MYGINRLLHPEIFQGANRKKGYFEGWYFKCVDETAHNIIAFIPGVSYGDSLKDSHAFIQVIDGSRNRSGYFSFPLSEFKYEKDSLMLHIGRNSFSSKGLTVSLKNSEMSYKGSLSFLNREPYPKKALSPGIMGPFGLLGFMECYHGVVNVSHDISGSMVIDKEEHGFKKGRGYIEKDWGTSFPEAWVWLQCNHFDKMDASFMLSYAHIPFLGKSFNGLIGFLSVNGRFYRFSTYQGYRVTSLDYENGLLTIIVEGRHHALSVTAAVKPGNNLKSPKMGSMTGDLVESMTSSLSIHLIKKNGGILFEGEGRVAGVELSGDLGILY